MEYTAFAKEVLSSYNITDPEYYTGYSIETNLSLKRDVPELLSWSEHAMYIGKKRK